MLKNFRSAFILALIVLAFLTFAAAADAQAVRFKIRLDPSLSHRDTALGGRLLIFMTARKEPLKTIEPDFTDPKAVWITAVEVSNLQPDKPIEVDPDVLSFPAPFSAAPAGDYQVMALLDTNHSYTYNGPGAGDIYSSVIKIHLPAKEVELVLSDRTPENKLDVPSNVKVIEFESPSLSKFWGRPVMVEASVLLPPSYDRSKLSRFPAVYGVHGYGGDHLGILRGAANVTKQMTDGKLPEMIYVYLNAHCPLGHHVFADSANNGPWGHALTSEFIPYLEKQFRMDARPSGRFLTGHSSGGSTVLWLQVAYPDVFGGTWSTSPDPVDFRNFTGPDLTKYPPQNFYTDAGGKPYNLVRRGGKEIMTVDEYARQERVLGYYGGQFASFDAVFSPKGDDGRPMPLFDRDTGRIDPFVQKAWEKYDISRILRGNWKTLGPKLKGKIHIIVGTADTFHLDEAVRLLDAELKKLGSDARIEYLEGRDHFDLYKGGLSQRIAQEMYAVARPKAKAAGK